MSREINENTSARNFLYSNVLEVSAWRLCIFCLDLAAAKTPGVQRVRHDNPQFAATALPWVPDRPASAPDLYVRIFTESDERSIAGAAALRSGDSATIGALMNVCHGMLNAIEVSTPELEKMIQIARQHGASGAKLTGAGGGGSIVALCPGCENEVSAALRAAGYQIIRLQK